MSPFRFEFKLLKAISLSCLRRSVRIRFVYDKYFHTAALLESVRFMRCKNLQDFGLETMGKNVGSTLSHLSIESCPKITEYGLKHLELFS